MRGHRGARKESSKDAAVELDAQLGREKREHEHRRDVERALAAIEQAALDASWKHGKCETAFEPWESRDPKESRPWSARFRSRLPEYGPWLVEYRWTPVARALLEHAPILGLDIEDVLRLTPPNDSQRTRFQYALERFGELVRRVDDESFRRALGMELAARFTTDREHEYVPWYHWPFEAIPGQVRRLLEVRDSPHSQKCTPTAPATPSEPETGASPQKRSRIEWLSKAMFLVQEHPGWSDARVAREVGVSPSSLSRSKEYQAAAGLARGNPSTPRGNVTRDRDTGLRDVEAEYEDPEMEDGGKQYDELNDVEE